jgi:hypothetical protein
LRARPEQTQFEHLSDASFLGKLLELPANVRLDWKVFARYKHSSLFGLIVSIKEKKFYNIDTWTTLRGVKPCPRLVFVAVWANLKSELGACTIKLFAALIYP